VIKLSYLLCFNIIFCLFLKSEGLAKSNVQFMSGAKLLSFCKSDELENQAACEGYILGVQDAIYSGHLSDQMNLCIPNGISPENLRLKLIDFIEVLPETANYGAESVVAKSLQLHFRCKKN
tara:strand:+ start:383 stop:745 length:363 start_codon:yes stop_codon:yes gene_type:complete